MITIDTTGHITLLNKVAEQLTGWPQEQAVGQPLGAIFRLRDHTRRLFDSAKIYRINIPFTEEQLNHGQREVIAQNGLAPSEEQVAQWLAERVGPDAPSLG